MSGDTRFFYTYTYIDLVSAIASRLHALDKEIKKKKKNKNIQGLIMMYSTKSQLSHKISKMLSSDTKCI